jgi:tetratricopeptide (TPR) repeat protein
MKFQKQILVIVFMIVVIVCPRAFSQDADLYPWEAAVSKLQRAGALIAQKKYDEAQKFLAFCAEELPAPYNKIAEDRRANLESAAKASGSPEAYFGRWFIENAYFPLNAHEAALKFLTENPNHEEVRYKAWCLAELGKVSAAISEYEKKLPGAPSDWTAYYQKQIELLKLRSEKPRDAQVALRLVRERYFAGMEVAKDYFGALRELKRGLPYATDPNQKLEFYNLTIECLAALGDERGRFAWEDKLMRDFKGNAEVCANIMLSRVPRAKTVDEQIALYRKIWHDYPKTNAACSAQFTIGTILRGQKKYDEAIAEFSKLFNVQTANRRFDDYDGRAHWEVATILFEKGDFEAALAAFRDARQHHRLTSFCGNGNAQISYNYAFFEGRCLELLNRHDEAVRLYFPYALDGKLYAHPAIPTRVVDLYESAGQLQDLKSVLDAQDRSAAESIRATFANSGKRLSDDELRSYLPSKTMRRIIELREWEKAKKWDQLIGCLRIAGTLGGPEEEWARGGNFQAVEAAKLLAKHPDETVPLIIKRFPKASADDKWFYFALGLSGSPDAVAFLKEHASHQENSWYCNTLVYCLSLAGENGKDALAELSNTATGNLKGAIHLLDIGYLGKDDKRMTFPPIPAKLKLPNDPTEPKKSG